MRRMLLVCIAGLPVQLAHADIALRSGVQEVLVATRGGLIAEWRVRAPGASVRLLDAGAAPAARGAFQWRSHDAPTVAALEHLDYDAIIEDRPESITATLRSREPINGTTLTQRYVLDRASHRLRVQLEAPRGVAILLRPAAAFRPEPLPGFCAIYSGVEHVTIGAERQSIVAFGLAADRSIGTGPGEWTGFRSRFWAWVFRPDRAVRVAANAAGAEQGLLWDAGGKLELEAYAGPVEWKSLRVVDPQLCNMLFAGLWAPLRALAFALFFLLGFIGRWIPSPGLAIIALSLCVKILLFPLTRIADRWQSEVNAIQSRIVPRIAAIRRDFSGEEAHRRTLGAYREEGVSPWFTLKSLGGFAIQVPMFIAAFDMLAGNFALNGASFLWISDLARPDALAALPVRLPFFGGDFNLLPLLMTLITLASAVFQRDAALSPPLQQRQRRQLFVMAGGFLLLFYTFPAGMVLYWTANNGWHFLKILLTQPRTTA